jgi:lambda family phage tail tape measure protein
VADLDFSVNADTSGAISSLRRLESSVGTITSTLGNLGVALAGAFTFTEINAISSRFQDLRTTLQLLYKDTDIGAAAFDDIKKFAQSSIFSVENLTETVIKLKSAGLDPTVAQLRLFANVSSVAADSVGALQAITDLYSRTTAGGLGLEDLNRLADRGIPVFDILSKRLGITRLQVSEFGKSAEGAAIILKALEDGLQETFGNASELRANNVSQAMSNFGDSIANAADAVGQAGLNDILVTLLRSLSTLVEAVTPLITAFVKLISIVFNLATAFKPLTDAVITFVSIMSLTFVAGLVKGFFAYAASIKAVTVGMVALNAVTKKSPLMLFALGASVAVGAFELVKGKLQELGVVAEETAKNDGFKVFKDGQLGAGSEDLRGKLTALNESLNRFKAEMAAVVTSFARLNAETRQGILLDTELIGGVKEVNELRRAEADISRETARQIAALTDQKAKLTAQELKEGRAGIIDQTIAKIRQQADVDKAATAAAISANEARQRARQAELFTIQSQIDLQNNLQGIQNRIATLTMTEIERKYYDIEQAALASGRAAVRAEEARIGRPLNAEEQKRYYDEAVAGVKRLQDAEGQYVVSSRQFSTGWQQAFNDYVDSATNAADRAKNVFQTFTKGIEDSFVNFAKTGKLSFKSLLAQMAEDLLRSNIRQLLSTLGGAGAAGGGNFFGSLFAGFFANGGMIPGGKFGVVGERGPELVSGPATVTPLSASSTVVYNINAVDAASFKSLVARDPAFIHAVASQGARSIPTRR